MLIQRSRGVCSLNFGYHGREGEGGSGIRRDMLCSGWGLRGAGELEGEREPSERKCGLRCLGYRVWVPLGKMIGNVAGAYMRIESHRFVEI